MRELTQRPRRLRSCEEIRRLVRETRLSLDDLILPLFVTAGTGGPVKSMPGVFQYKRKEAVKQAQEASQLGIPAILLFGLPSSKDDQASEAYSPEGIVQSTVREMKEKVPSLVIMTDVCLCAYTSHGHCGVLRPLVGKGNAGMTSIDNDASLELLAQMAISHAEAGADIVAPSDMMDGRVRKIRQALDVASFSDIGIMSYAVKYASAFYGPFRDAAASAPQSGDRKSYQMDPANDREALREAKLDEREGADILMVKPALSCLDIIRNVRNSVSLPIAAYNVSGEYAMIKAAAEKKWIDEKSVMMETLLSIRRAGADMIVTYFAREAAKILG